MNVIFENEDATFRVEEDFKETRIKRKPKFHDEIINDTPYDCFKKKYEINVYNITLDTVIESLENRFSKHKEMYIDFEWLHPTNFKLINNLPENAMNKIAELLTDFSPNIDKKILQEQLIDFAGKWDSLSKTLLEEYNCMTLDLEKDDEEEESKLAKEHLVHKKTSRADLKTQSNPGRGNVASCKSVNDAVLQKKTLLCRLSGQIYVPEVCRASGLDPLTEFF
ncbi:hypothetical protein QTP88_004408 [Uroleucon formosanum]